MAISWTQNGTTFSSVQNLTGSAPTVQGDGIPLKGLTKLFVVLQANSSQTLSGAGSLQCYVYDGATGGVGGWARYKPGDCAVSSSGVQSEAYPTFYVDAPRNDYACWVPSGVTVSGGTTVTVFVLGFNPDLARLY